MFADLNCSVPSLYQQARELGWTEIRTSIVQSLASQQDLDKLKEKKKFASVPATVESQNPDLLRLAAKKDFVDLINPLLVPGFERDDGLVQIVADEKKVFEIPVAPILHSRHVFRAKLLNQLAAFIKLCRKLDAHFVFTSRAQEIYDLKSPRETMAIASLLGLNREQAKFAISEAAKKVLDDEK